jgi:hypothetical protein
VADTIRGEFIEQDPERGKKESGEKAFTLVSVARSNTRLNCTPKKQPSKTRATIWQNVRLERASLGERQTSTLSRAMGIFQPAG